MLASVQRRMFRLKFGRTEQMWLLVVVCLGLFAIFTWVLPGMTFTMWWKILAVAGASCIFSIGVFQIWLTRTFARRETAMRLIDRITAGDLSLTTSEIVATTQSQRMA